MCFNWRTICALLPELRREDVRRGIMICEDCKYAIWDYEEYYGGQQQWFVSDCKKDWPFWLKEDCEDYEEYEPCN